MSKSIEFVKDLDEIIILAQGPSWYQCPEEVSEKTEIWGSNSIYRDHKVDRLFLVHDIRLEMFSDDKDFVKHVNEKELPVYTAGIFKVINKNAQIPVIELLTKYNKRFFLNVICWMIATATLQRPKSIHLYGVDMRPDAQKEAYVNEKGCVEFWCGVAIGSGISVKTTKESYVMKIKQEGNFPNSRKKLIQDGVYATVPKEERNPQMLRNWVILPVGDEI